jgi:hypothetical protein
MILVILTQYPTDCSISGVAFEHAGVEEECLISRTFQALVLHFRDCPDVVCELSLQPYGPEPYSYDWGGI